MQIHIVTLYVEGDQVGIWATVHPEKADALIEKLENRVRQRRGLRRCPWRGRHPRGAHRGRPRERARDTASRVPCQQSLF